VTGFVLRNGRIWTGDPSEPWAREAAIEGGRFVQVGNDLDAPLDGIIDLDGKLVVPGFWDAHAHLAYTGTAMAQVQLKGATSIDEVQRRVAERVASTPPGDWIEGAGWDQNDWPDARFPGRSALDAIAPHHPVVLVHTSGHCSWVNSAALEAAGIAGSSPVPEGGSLSLDEAGEPTGMLFDRAMDLVAAAIPARGPHFRTDAVLQAIKHAHSLGIVGVHAMDVGRGELEALRSLHAEGRLGLRVRAFLSARDEALWEGHATSDGDEWLRIGGVKWFADGALGSLTAWMEAPYEGSEEYGFPLQPVAELEASVRRALSQGLAPAVHAIGDQANREVLDLLERLAPIHPHLPRRIEHAQLLALGLAQRFAALGITASVQPIHATQDMPKVDRHWGARGTHAYAFRSLLDAGVNLAFGSDTPVETMDPLAGIHAAVTRQRADGTPAGGWQRAERVTVEDALRGYTTGPAHAVGEQDVAGRIATGYAADCAVLSHDIVRDPASLLEAQVEMTLAGGEVVYVRKGSRFEDYATSTAGART
jgi:hypothetical protein